MLSEAAGSDQVGYRELLQRRKDGSLFWCSLTGHVRRDAEGRILWMEGILTEITQRKQAEEALRQAHRLLMTAREEERRYLAAELHDSVGQSLVALKFSLENVLSASDGQISAAAGEALRGVRKRCAELIREVRHICQGLYPPALESLGLAASLGQLAGYCRVGHLRAEVACPEDVRSARFDQTVEIALYRIAQEAVTNALRHSGADRVVIGLERAGDRLRLTVTDNGRGFDPSPGASVGMGLTTMRQRAGAVGGELTIDSRPGRTCVEASVPAGAADDPARAAPADTRT